MKFTHEENMTRRAIVAKAVADASAYLAGAGYHLTPEQAELVSQRMGLSIAEHHANEPDPKALDLLVTASMLQTVGEVLGILAPADPVAWLLELCVVGGEAARVLMVAGGYPCPSKDTMKLMTGALRRRAEVLVSQGMALDPEAARQDMRDFAARVVSVTLGDPPSRVNIH